MKTESSYRDITLIEKRADNTADALKAALPDRKLCICDLYVTGSEAGLRPDGIITYQDLLIIDHYAPVPAMRHQITSVDLANTYVRNHGPLDPDVEVVINHTDTDALLSALIMRGILEPDAEYAAAARSADHRGGTHALAELLQALEKDRDLEHAVTLVMKIVTRRLRVRRLLAAKVRSGGVRWHGGVATVILDEKVDAGLAPAVLPEAAAIVVASPMEDGDKPWRIRVRLGPGVQGVALDEMDLPDAGGRWNAVSTSRHGGTDVAPEDYARLVRRALEKTADEPELRAARPQGLALTAPQARCAVQDDAAHYAKTRGLVDAFAALLDRADLTTAVRRRLWDALSVMLDVHICQEDRPNGQPYVNHPLKVALWLDRQAGIRDPDVLIAALLHDTIEDRAAPLIARCGGEIPAAGVRAEALRTLARRFGERPAELVDRLTNPPSYERATDLVTKWRWYHIHVRRLWAEDPAAAALKLADFAQNALRLDRIADPGTKVRLQAKYRPAMRFFIAALESLDDPTHPLYAVGDALGEQMKAVYKRDYNRKLFIELPLADFDLAAEGVVLDGKVFKPKDEVHITVIGKELAAALREAVERDPALEHQIDLAIVEAPWYAPGWSYVRTGRFYHVDRWRREPERRKEEGPKESIIERVEAPDVVAFFARLSALTGEAYEVPPLHVTLYIHGDPYGVGLPNRKKFRDCKVRELPPDLLP